MAHSILTYTGDGATTDFLFDKPYIKEADVHGFVGGVDSAISFVDPTHIRFAVAPADGSPISVKRLTDPLAPSFAFPNRTYIKSENLDGNSTQQLYLHQETLDVTDATVNAEQSAAEAAASAAAAQTSADDSSNSASTSQASMLNAIAASVITADDVLETNADVILTGNDVALTNADVLLTHADVVLTNQDTVDTAQDLVDTNQDTIDTAADVVLTHADVVLTGDDVLAAQTSADNAQQSAVDAGAVYLGAHATAPTLDNYGNPLIIGSTYLNTTNDPQDMWVYADVGWILQATSVASTAADVALSDPLELLIASNLELAVAELATQTPEMALPNLNFDNGFVGWTDTSVGGSVTLDSAEGVTPGNALLFTLTTDTDVPEITSDFFVLDPNSLLHLNAKCRTATSALQHFDVTLDMYTSAGAYVSSIVLLGALNNAATWIDFVGSVDTSNFTGILGKITISSRYFAAQTLPSTLYVDELQIQKQRHADSIGFTPSESTNFNGANNVAYALNILKADHGAWTPTLEGATTAGTGWTFTNNVGQWSRVGNLLLVSFTINVTAVSVDAVGAIHIADSLNDLPASITSRFIAGSLTRFDNVNWDAAWKQVNLIREQGDNVNMIALVAGSVRALIYANPHLTNTSIIAGSYITNISYDLP